MKVPQLSMNKYIVTDTLDEFVENREILTLVYKNERTTHKGESIGVSVKEIF